MEVQDPSPPLLGDAKATIAAATAVSKGKWHQTQKKIRKKKIFYLTVIFKSDLHSFFIKIEEILR